MYIRPRFPFVGVLIWTWKVLPVVALWALIVTGAHHLLNWEWLRIPAMLVAVLGTAVSFYLGFKGSAAYGRLWEARQIWGGIVNSSRTFGMHVKTMVSDLHRDTKDPEALGEIHRELIYRHVGWLAALRTQLRRRTPWEHDTDENNAYRRRFNTHDMGPEELRRRLKPFVPEDELDLLMAQKNQATQLVRRQGERLQELYAQGRIDDFRHMELARLLETLYTLQGKCERIKNFPLPRQYSSANHWFVKIFILLLPFGLLSGFHSEGLSEAFVWGTVPATAILGWVFYVWDQVLEYSENPFEGLINDIPMDALSRTIEIDLREMLGENELPPPVAAVNGDVLM